MICSFLLTLTIYLYLPCMTFLQHWTQLIILCLYTVSILTLDLLMLSFNGFLPIRLIVHTTSLYLIIVLLLLLYTQVFLRVQFLALCFPPCILSLCLPILNRTIIHHSFADDLQLQMSAPPDKYPSYFTLCSHV